MSKFNDSLTRAFRAAVTGGKLGARIGGSVTAVFGPFVPGGAAIGGLIGSVVGAAGSLWLDFSV